MSDDEIAAAGDASLSPPGEVCDAESERCAAPRLSCEIGDAPMREPSKGGANSTR